MRASFPAFRVCIRRHGIWRCAVAALIACTFAVQAVWLAGHADDTPWAASVALAAFDLAAMAGAAGLLRIPPADLAWDTHGWRLDARPGNLTIALDLGAWMLLRFDHDAPRRRGHRVTWLPVQRRGLEPQWHALRCAVYCARPALGTDAGSNSAAGPESQE